MNNETLRLRNLTLFGTIADRQSLIDFGTAQGQVPVCFPPCPVYAGGWECSLGSAPALVLVICFFSDLLVCVSRQHNVE